MGSIFGDGSDARLQLRTVTTKQKVDYPAHGDADLSISAISMTCERWNKVAFSTEYFTARHEFLVRKDAPVQAASDLAGRRVCMTKGSTSIDTLARMGLQPPPVPRLVDARTDCLVALQEGEVDAYFGHDTFLVGMVNQDPGLRIVPQGDLQHYGIAAGPDNVTLVRYVNGVLDRLREDGTLARLYERWLGPLYLGAGEPLPAVPVPEHLAARDLEGGVMSARRWTVGRGRDGRARRSGGVLVAVEQPGLPVARRADRSHHHDGRAVDRDHHGADDVRPPPELRARPHPAHPDGRCHQERAACSWWASTRARCTGATATRSNGTIRGLDVDILRQIALAIFGSDPDAHLQFKTLTTAERVQAVQSGKVDMVASLLTATCDRWNDVDFSTVYYEANQDVLVPVGSPVQTVTALAGKTVCATRGSTSITNIQHQVPTAKIYPVDTRADCLVALQDGEVDAITSDDTILKSFQAQEEKSDTRLLRQPLENEPYAIAMPKGHEDLVRFVNDVLDHMRADGSLEALYREWLGDEDAPPAPPAPGYGR